MAERLDWERDGGDWPHRTSSRFVAAAGLRWHVQQLGEGPAVLLVHGTGASGHSWRGLLPLLARRHTVLSLDLPGHGFTSAAPGAQMSLPGMAQAVGSLLATLGVAPVLAIGHSAGAAIAARMALDGRITPRALLSLNGAFLPWGGLPGWLFVPAARLLALNPWMPRLFARRAQDEVAVRRLVAATGSTLDAAGLALYARLVRSPGHVAAALAMMANWDLAPLQRELPRLAVPLTLVAGSADRTLPPRQAGQVVARVPGARVQILPGLGHLAHEEAPEQIDRIAAALPLG